MLAENGVKPPVGRIALKFATDNAQVNTNTAAIAQLRTEVPVTAVPATVFEGVGALGLTLATGAVILRFRRRR